ncbi:hypothetical protein CDD83_11159 [Cordyceps sp. RAO-2017]|nr:hypothetical protein CDD83_11159 [Cordyceps sp. RAO-2017]
MARALLLLVVAVPLAAAGTCRHELHYCYGALVNEQGYSPGEIPRVTAHKGGEDVSARAVYRCLHGQPMPVASCASGCVERDGAARCDG